jgi:hypothetical protein
MQHLKRDYDSAHKVCNDGSMSRRKPSSIKPLCNTFANNCGDMFANPNVFRCVKFESQGWENVVGSKRLLLKSLHVANNHLMVCLKNLEIA